MDRQGRGPAAWSRRKGCERQAVGQVVSNRQMAEMGVHHALLFREVSNWKPGMSPGYLP